MKQINIGNFNVLILKAGQPDLQRLGLSEDEYELRCTRKNKILEAYSMQLRYNGFSNPYCERNESQKHQDYNRSMEVLPTSFDYFLEDDTDKKLLEVEYYLSQR